jgi:hypothetical protein
MAHTRPLDGIDAQHAHGVDLLADGPRAEVGADGGGAGARDHEHGDHGPQLGHGAERRAGARQVGRTDLTQKDVERERDQHRERDRHEQGGHQRDAGDHPGLVEELPELERAHEHRPERVDRHLEEAAHGPRRNRKLFDQPRSPSRSEVR